MKSGGHTKKMRQVKEYFPCYFQTRKKGRGKKWCFVTLTEIWSGLSLLGVDCNSILIQSITEHHIKLLAPQTQQHFINYAQRLNMQAYWLSREHSVSPVSLCVCIFISAHTVRTYLIVWEKINHTISRGTFDKPTPQQRKLLGGKWTDFTFFLWLQKYRWFKIVQLFLLHLFTWNALQD